MLKSHARNISNASTISFGYVLDALKQHSSVSLGFNNDLINELDQKIESVKPANKNNSILSSATEISEFDRTFTEKFEEYRLGVLNFYKLLTIFQKNIHPLCLFS